jgi:hypothetical protein
MAVKRQTEHNPCGALGGRARWHRGQLVNTDMRQLLQQPFAGKDTRE